MHKSPLNTLPIYCPDFDHFLFTDLLIAVYIFLHVTLSLVICILLILHDEMYSSLETNVFNTVSTTCYQAVAFLGSQKPSFF